MSRTFRSGYYLEAGYGESKHDSTRDCKKCYKPHKKFKNVTKGIRKAKIKQAIAQNKEIPLFKATNVWDWN